MNKKFSLVSQILRGPWLIAPDYAMSQMPLVANLLEGKDVKAWFDDDDDDEEKPKPIVALSMSADGQFVQHSSFDEAPEGSISVIKIKGAMMKDDYCGAPGTSTLNKLAKEADSHSHIVAHLFHTESPGGTVAGTEDFSIGVRDLKKPKVNFIELMASAAVWVGSGMTENIASGETAMIGSIGTMLSISDWRAAAEKAGAKFHDVRATESKDKNEAYYQILQGNYGPIRSEMLDPLNDVFLSHVKANRAGKLNLKKENVLTGKMYLAKDALEYGLIDSIGSYEYAVQRAFELAKSNSNNNQMLKNWFSGSAKTDAATIVVKTAELDELRADAQKTIADLDAATVQVSELTQKLTDANSTITALTAERDAAVANANQLTADLATANTSVTELTEKVEKYGAQPGAMRTSSVKTGTEITETKVTGFFDPTAEHNQVEFN
jgi:ClpP class serine protease